MHAKLAFLKEIVKVVRILEYSPLFIKLLRGILLLAFIWRLPDLIVALSGLLQVLV